MAHQAVSRSLWNRRNPQEQGLLIKHPRYSDILNNKRPSLMSKVQPASLWPHLRKYRVLGEHVQEKITLNTTRAQQVDQLVNHLEHGPTWQLHSFMRSCSLTDQGHIISHVGLDPETYKGPSPPDSDTDDSFNTTVDSMQEASCVTPLTASSPNITGHLPPFPQVDSHRSENSTETGSSRSFLQRMMACLSCEKDDDDVLPVAVSSSLQTPDTITHSLSPFQIVEEQGPQLKVKKTSNFPSPSSISTSGDFRIHESPQQQLTTESPRVDKVYQSSVSAEPLGNIAAHVTPQRDIQGQSPAALDTSDIPVSFTSSQKNRTPRDPLQQGYVPGKFEKTLTEALVVHCEYYREHLMTGRVFDFKHCDTETMFYDIDDCYMQQDAEFKQYKSVADQIKMRDVLRKFGRHPMPRTVLLVGHPGVGKSTFFTRFAYCWSLDFLKYRQNPDFNTCPQHTVVIYVSARVLTTDIWGSIENELCCRGYGRKAIMNVVASEEALPEYLSAILMDRIDEIRDEKILQALQSFLEQNHKHGGPQIFVSARTGLSRLDKSLFDRFLSLDGFTLTQGLDYTHKYITQNWKDDGVEEPSVLQYIERNKEELTPILCNPLKTHILSALAVKGLLRQNDGTVPQSVDLLKMMESFFIKRETDGEGVSAEESGKFYRLCLYGLLENIQQFTEKDLKKFKVQQSPYVSFFRKEMRKDKSANNVSLYSFEHEVLYEFFAARAIETLPEWKMKAVLLYIGSRKILRNLQKLMVGMLSDYDKQRSVPLLVGMVRLILVHASLDERSLKVAITAKGLQNYALDLTALRDRIHDTLPAPGDLLDDTDREESLSRDEAVEIWQMVNKLFDTLVDLMKTNQSPHTPDYWAQLYYGSKGFISKVILNVLADCTAEHREEIARNTYLRMLPCHGFYVCGGSRWFSMSSSHINCWSTEDLKCTTQYRSTPVKETTDRLFLHFQNTPSQWGHAPDDHWACGAWDTALQAVTGLYSVTNKLTFYLTHDPPLKGLLESLTHLDQSDHPCRDVEIQLGHISLENLHQWHQGDKPSRSIKLSATELHLPPDEQKRKKLLWLLATGLLDAVKTHIAQCGEKKHRLKKDYKVSDTLTLSQPCIQFVSQC